MMLDTKNNTTGNNEAEEKQEQETPQSIFEKRLAEIKARNGGGDQENPAPEENSSDSIMAGAIAAHEVIPPINAVPLVGIVDTPAPYDDQVPDAPEAAAVTTETAEPAATPVPDPSPPAITSEAASQETVASGTASSELPPPEAPSAVPSLPESLIKEEANASAGPGSPAGAGDTGTLGSNPQTDAPEVAVQADVVALAPEPSEPQALAQTEEPVAPAGNVAPVEVTGTPEAMAESQAPEATISQQPPVADSTPAVAPAEENGPAVAEPVLQAPAAGLMDDDHHEEHHEELLPEADYSTLSISELRQSLMSALKTASRKNSRQIYDMHRQYETKIGAEKAEALQRFISEGNDADDFEYNTGLAHSELEQAFQLFRENRNRDQRLEEEQRIKNSQRKNELLEQLRELVESPETRSSSDKIKSIQGEWKTIGPVPTSESQQMWSSYHALLDIFYNNRSIFFELKELDRRKNLQHKIQLCERAEALADNPSINTALQELRNLHEEWKNVGPVPNEFRDSIWERFIQASEKIHARKKEFISERRVQEQDNLTKKQDLLTRISIYQLYQTDRINDWRDKTDEIQKLKEEWDSIGLVPKERADEVNKQFWASYKAFFNHKNAFFKSLDEQKMQNLRLKTELCEQAETLKDSTEWDETKEKLIQLQKKWKTIGRVPDKYSDKLWNRFRAACNEFFDRKQNQVQQREAAIHKVSAEKTAFFDEVATRLTTLEQEPGSLEELEAIRNKWEAFESNRGQNKLDDRFYDLLQKYVDSISGLSEEEKDGINIELQVDHIRQSPDASHRLHQKEQSIRKEIAHLENDIRTLKTNIEFFGRSKNAEKLKEEYQARINEADHRIQLLQQQLYAFRNA